MAHPFTVEHALLRLVEVVIGGIAYGLVVAFVVGRVRRYVRDPSIQILVTLVTPFLAYIPAEQLKVSGVLATVVAGLYLGTRTEGMLQPASRVSGRMFWRTLIFLLESALFVLLGLELRAVVSEPSNVVSVSRLAGAIIGIRLVWELAVSPLIRFLPGKHSLFVVNPWRYRLVIGWGGMRGAISLAIALTLPTMVNGRPFAERSVLILLAAVVVVVTLLGEGLTLGPLVSGLGLAQSEQQQRREAVARQRVTEAGLARLDEMAEAGEVDDDTANVYRQLFELRLDRVRSVLGDDEDAPDTSGFRHELVVAQRDKLAELYAKGKISDDIRVTRASAVPLSARPGRSARGEVGQRGARSVSAASGWGGVCTRAATQAASRQAAAPVSSAALVPPAEVIAPVMMEPIGVVPM